MRERLLDILRSVTLAMHSQSADFHSPLEAFIVGGCLHCAEHYAIGSPVQRSRIRHLVEPDATMKTSFLWMFRKKKTSIDPNITRTYRTAIIPLVVEGGLFVNLKQFSEDTVEKRLNRPRGSVLNGMASGAFSGAFTSFVGYPLGALLYYYRRFVVDAPEGSSNGGGSSSFRAYCTEIRNRSVRYAFEEGRAWALRLMFVNWLLSRRDGKVTPVQEIGAGVLGGAVAGLICCALEPSAGLGLLLTWAKGNQHAAWAWVRFRCGLWQKVVSSSALTVALVSVPSVLHSNRDAMGTSMKQGMDWVSLGVFGGC